MKGKVFSVCLSSKKGTKKEEVDGALLIDGWGIEGDAHAGSWPLQVSFLPIEEIDRIKRLIPDLKPGDFAENIITQGIDLRGVEAGDRIVIGEEAILEVTQIGKECHSACRIQKQTGKCIMPTKGVFTRVIKGGIVKKDFLVRLQKRNP